MRKPYQSHGSDEKLILLYCPGRDRTHDLPHTVASNMVKVSHALNHSATEAVYRILSVYTLLKVVSYYDLSVRSMSVMGFKKKSLYGGWVGGLRSTQVFLDFFNFAKPLSVLYQYHQ